MDELRQEIRLARSLAAGGVIGINIMVAARQFADIVHTAIEEGIDLVVPGAGFSRECVWNGKGIEYSDRSGWVVDKAAKISESLGASAIVVEGKEAGGHLGTLEPCA